MEALGSPSAPHTSAPDFITTCGRIPKNLGIPEDEVGELARLAPSPTSWSMPCATAGLIVYFAT